ncbi:hypothetical protein UFOVP373_54 [uncultured Caudovirales phage]|uniref:Uncharacterized protein n=1 Tax=uncultured Caudovirales phage TaxID=2100421 RepID=A0A6J7WZA2_9CAUD|nr:hypothetical protein UFOVP373_54 [uncultured Caudovirales phage]
MTEADKLREYIAQKQAQMDDLEKRYGNGVRPSWLSQETTVLAFYIRDAEDQLKQLEANNATDHSSN